MYPNKAGLLQVEYKLRIRTFLMYPNKTGLLREIAALQVQEEEDSSEFNMIQ